MDESQEIYYAAEAGAPLDYLRDAPVTAPLEMPDLTILDGWQP